MYGPCGSLLGGGPSLETVDAVGAFRFVHG
jgi:hypothetical protein